MPELPEVETTVRGLRPYMKNRIIQSVNIRERRLRWPVPVGLEKDITGCRVIAVERRAKYILIHLNHGGLLAHLGMSGSFRVVEHFESPGKHDHYDLMMDTGKIIRFKDPRRFGSLLYSSDDVLQHPRLANQGMEPLTSEFNADYLYKTSKGRSVPVKTLIMDGKVVSGVGNIYSSEALYLSGIHPLRKCSRVSIERYALLVKVIQEVLQRAIEKGGTTLQDFSGADGEPGYFEQALLVYGRKGQACLRCKSDIKSVVIAQRSTFYCSRCQK